MLRARLLNSFCEEAAMHRALAVGAVVLSTLTPTQAGELVPFAGYSAGTIVVKTSARRLYAVVNHERAVRYVVGVGRLDKQWRGTSSITGKYLKPDWGPTAEIKRDNPKIPDVIRGGAPNNPMGAAALMLSGGEYAIHGTNNPGSIGGFVSYGCIRMHNRDILELYELVGVGTLVVVLP